MLGKSWLILLLSAEEHKLGTNRLQIRDDFIMPPIGGDDSRLPVIGALGYSLVDVIDLIQRATNEAQRQAIVLFSAAARPAKWPAELRLISLESDELTLQAGCLCCSWRAELPGKLGQLFLDVLRKRQPAVKAVVVVSASRNVGLLHQTLGHAPFLAQRYRLSYCLRLAGA